MRRFTDAHRLVRVAETKFKHLKAATNRHIETAVAISAKDYPRGCEIFAEILEPLPDGIVLELVTVSSNLLAALNKMIAVLIDERGHSTSSNADFPFRGMGSDGNPREFPTAGMKRVKNKFSEEQWSRVLSYKPYPGGNDALWGINKVTNSAKHGLGLVEMIIHPSIVPTGGQVTAIPDPVNPRAFSGELHLFGKPTPNQQGEFLIGRVVNLKGQIEFQQSVQVVFADIPPVHGQNVLVVLKKQIRLVKNILQEFAAL